MKAKATRSRQSIALVEGVNLHLEVIDEAQSPEEGEAAEISIFSSFIFKNFQIWSTASRNR